MTERVMSTAVESAAKPGRRRGHVLVVLTLIAMALITVLVLGASYALHAYDRSHVTSVACTVTAAEGDVGSSSSGKGIGSSFDQVEISTKECGPLVLRRGVTAENKEAIAARLEAGGRSRFEIGAASFRFREVLVSVRERVVVFGFSEQR
jgi:predicted Zn-dependent protease